MSLPSVKQYLIGRISDYFAPMKVRWIGGAFDANELRRHILDAPIVLISILELGDWVEMKGPKGTRYNASAKCVAYILANGENRDDTCLEIVSSMMALITKLNSAGDGYRLPANTQPVAQNLYSGRIDGLAVALWGIQWDALVSFISEEN